MPTLVVTDREVSAFRAAMKFKLELAVTLEDLAELGAALQTLTEKFDEAAATAPRLEAVNQ